MEDAARITARADLDALAVLLADVPEARLAAVAQDLFTFLPLPARFSWSDKGSVVDSINLLPTRSADTPPLLLFAARLAHEVDDLRSLEINRWVDAVGRSARLTDGALRRLYQTSRIPKGGGSPADPDTSSYTGKSDILNTQNEDALTSRISTVSLPRMALERANAPRIWGGGIPIRNPDFTGRETLLLTLQRSLETRSKASVLPHALHGFGGVGKTQLAVEYAYRYADRYDLVWWVPSEQQSLVYQSLAELGRQLDIPVTEELSQGSSLVLDALSSTNLRWLLIYDNATEPEDLAHLVPSVGGHVILTSRDQTWTNVWDAIEVNVFDRTESVALIQKRGTHITREDADRLADTLGDLPLALDQAASWQSATAMPVAEYLDLFDQHVRVLLSEGKPTTYPTTIAALVKLAFEKLRSIDPAVAQLLEMFAVFGSEPVSIDLLLRGRFATIPRPLGPALRDAIKLRQIIRNLRKYGLAKVDPDNRVQVHRLFQLVLRDELSTEQIRQRRADVHRLLGTANPGEPDTDSTHAMHSEIGPHVRPARLIDADTEDARRVVLDQVRYLWVVGDNEGSRRLGEDAVKAWSRPSDQPDIGPTGELTLLATRHLANALFSLGINERARALARKADEGFSANPEFGEEHEHTIASANVVALGLRVKGEYAEAKQSDELIVQRCVRAFGDEDPSTLRNRGNLAVDLRMLSRFREAFELDKSIVDIWQKAVPEQDRRLLFAQSNLARDLYGLGRYAEAFELQQRVLPLYRQVMANPKHPEILLAARTLAIAGRKTGNYDTALREARENYRDCGARYGMDHQHSLAATMTYANSLRTVGKLGEARGLAIDAVTRYRQVFGPKHPLTLTALINQAIILRGLGDLAEARRLDESAHSLMVSTLGAEHGYTLCAASNLVNDLALAGEVEQARTLSTETLARSRRSRGDDHPYTLLCAVNNAFDLIAAGAAEAGRSELNTAVDTLSEAIGEGHPEVIDARRGVRAECDIEPPPA